MALSSRQALFRRPDVPVHAEELRRMARRSRVELMRGYEAAGLLDPKYAEAARIVRAIAREEWVTEDRENRVTGSIQWTVAHLDLLA